MTRAEPAARVWCDQHKMYGHPDCGACNWKPPARMTVLWATLRARPDERCRHRSHRWRLPCLRLFTYDYQCGKHNGSCFMECPDV